MCGNCPVPAHSLVVWDHSDVFSTAPGTLGGGQVACIPPLGLQIEVVASPASGTCSLLWWRLVNISASGVAVHSHGFSHL